MLYFGPRGRSGGTVYRVLFHIVEPEEGESPGIVRILHVYHGAQRTVSQTGEETADE